MNDETDLKKAFTKVAKEAGGLGVEIADIAGSMDQVSLLISEQAASFHDLQERAQEITDNNTNIKEVSHNTRDRVNSSRHNMQRSSQVVEGTLNDIHALINSVADFSEQLNELQKALDEVSQVARTIDHIAGQTNLLALNATIEAARAGDAGRGFSVVANEVKALSTQTTNATSQISHTVTSLAQQINHLKTSVELSTKNAQNVRDNTTGLSHMVNEMDDVLTSLNQDAESIVKAAQISDKSCSTFSDTLKKMTLDVEIADENMANARDRTNQLISSAEKLVQMTVISGIETIDTPMIEKARQTAALISKKFEEAISTQAISETDLFDFNYHPIPGSNPEQVMAKFTALMDKILPDIQEPVLSFDKRIIFCATVDQNGYLPTHNLKFSKPQRPSDPEWNMANCRNRRIFDDRVGLNAGRSKAPFLLQAYRRDMGGGVFALMKDISASIYVKGRHWGGVRIGYTS